jgi:hypothetical protein
MQASLAVGGFVASLWSAWIGRDPWLALGSFLLGAVVPFTFVAILPINNRLLDPSLDPGGEAAIRLLARWGRLHAVRSVLSSVAFALFLLRLLRNSSHNGA